MSREIVAYLSPPSEERYQKYSDYLQDFEHFLEKLAKHPNVASAQTQKRPVVPSSSSLDNTIARVRAKLPQRVLQSSDSETEGEAPRCTTPVSVTSAVLVERPIPAKTEPVDILDSIRSARDPEAAAQIGKKAAKATLKNWCSPGLADRLVDVNRVSRKPSDFNAVVEFIRIKSEKHGRKLAVNDVNMTVVNGPSPPPNRCEYPDFREVWNSDEDVEPCP